MRKLLALVLIPALLVAGCGGGGGGYGGSSSGGSSSGGSSGGSSSGGNCCGTQVPIAAGPPNVEPLVIDTGPAALSQASTPVPAIDTAYISVKVCAHNSPGTCAVIDHVQVDTGSSGFRIVAAALSDTTNVISGGQALLTALQSAYVQDPVSHGTLTECVQFAIGYSYGSVTSVDITLPTSGETASGVNTQLIGDPNYSAAAHVPNSCSTGTGGAMNDVVSFGANGIIGVGILPADNIGLYYVCGPCSTSTPPTTPSNSELLQNPVVMFPMDNNGTIIQLPAVSNAGTTNPTNPPGVIVFGIGTQSNNKLGSATVLELNLQNTGLSGPAFTATVNNTAYEDSFLDSGTNFLAISGAAVPASLAPCTGATDFYCTSATVNFTATAQGQTGNPPMTTGTSTNANFSIADALTLFNANNGANTAVPNLGGPNSADPSSVDFGLPFFYGRYVYTGIMGQTVTGATTPFFAY